MTETEVRSLLRRLGERIREGNKPPKETVTMTKSEALKWVRWENNNNPDAQYEPDPVELRAAWSALYGGVATGSAADLWRDCVEYLGLLECDQ